MDGRGIGLRFPAGVRNFFLLFLLRMLFLWNLFSNLFRSEFASGAGITRSAETKLPAGWPRVGVRFPAGPRHFLFSVSCRLALGHIGPPIQWVPEPSPRMKLTTHFHLIPRLRMVRLYLYAPTRPHGIVLH
jgi:hypothetical protein